jgi:8-oxo-dGTP diphosphatase
MRGLAHFITALILSIILLPIGFIYSVGKKLFDSIDVYLYSISFQINRLGNYVCGDLFNDLLIKKKAKGKYSFGNLDKSISYCIGQNLLLGSLSKLGLFINKILNTIEKEHTIKAIHKGN